MAEQNSNLDALTALRYIQQAAKLGGQASSLFGAPGASTLFGGAGGAAALPASLMALGSGDPRTTVSGGLNTLQNLNSLSKLYSYFSPALSGGTLAAEAAALAPAAAAELAAGTTSAGLAGIAGLPMGAGATGAAAGAGAGSAAGGAAGSAASGIGAGLSTLGTAIAPLAAVWALADFLGFQPAAKARLAETKRAFQTYPTQLQENARALPSLLQGMQAGNPESGPQLMDLLTRTIQTMGTNPSESVMGSNMARQWTEQIYNPMAEQALAAYNSLVGANPQLASQAFVNAGGPDSELDRITGGQRLMAEMEINRLLEKSLSTVEWSGSPLHPSKLPYYIPGAVPNVGEGLSPVSGYTTTPQSSQDLLAAAIRNRDANLNAAQLNQLGIVPYPHGGQMPADQR